jgi:hypothetical protein
VRVAGEPATFAAEIDDDPQNIDHFWITIRTEQDESVQISLSTLSRYNRKAGFDPRMRLAIVRSTWSELPAPGIFPAPRFSYEEVERAAPVSYVAEERPALERLLLDRSRRAIFIEAWGAFYGRGHIGIHQVHCRRASYSVRTDVKGSDGAIRFYFAADTSLELLLFKFAGQP